MNNDDDINKLRCLINECIDKYSSSEEKFDVNLIKDTSVAFNKCFNSELSTAYLAHYKFAIESLIKKYKNQLTYICYTERELSSEYVGANVRYYRGGYIISVANNKDYNDEEKRIHIGHELSHILIDLLNDKIYNSASFSQPENKEFIASLLSLLVHMLQSNFYKEKSTKFIYNDTQELYTKIFDIYNKRVFN